MDDTQSAIRLIDAITTLPPSIVEFIHATVSPREVNHIESTHLVSANSAVRSTRVMCTKSVCHGPHPVEKCWSKPQNFRERDDFLARCRTRGSLNHRGRQLSTQSIQMLLLNAEFDPITSSPEESNHTSFELITSEPEANSLESINSDTIWALHDTGATHHMFNDKSLFVKDSLKPVEDKNRRLKLAGGEVSLAVDSIGKIKLKAGDNSVFELTECLFVPELRKNLISGGTLKRKGVREVYNDSEPTCFALVKDGLALFNGVILQNGLMNVKITPVI